MATGSVRREKANSQDAKSWFTAAETGDQETAAVISTGNIVTLTFRTGRRQHYENDVIMTVPTEYLPSNDIEFIAYTNGEAFVMRLYGKDRGSNTGKIVVWTAIQETGEQRIYATVTYIADL